MPRTSHTRSRPALQLSAVALATGILLATTGCQSSSSSLTSSASPMAESYARQSFVDGAISFDAPIGGDTFGVTELARAQGFEIDPKTHPALMQIQKRQSIFSVDTNPEPPSRENRELQPIRLQRRLVITNHGAGVVRLLSHHDRATFQRIDVKVITLPTSIAGIETSDSYRAKDDAVFEHIKSTTLVTDDYRKLVVPAYVELAQKLDDRRGLPGRIASSLPNGDTGVTIDTDTRQQSFLGGRVVLTVPAAIGESHAGRCLYASTLCREAGTNISGGWRISSLAVYEDDEPPYWKHTDSDQPAVFREVITQPELSQRVVRSAYLHDTASGRNLAIRLITSRPPFAVPDGALYDARVAADDAIFQAVVASIRTPEIAGL